MRISSRSLRSRLDSGSSSSSMAGPDHQRARQRHALALAARHLQRPARPEAGQLDHRQRLGDAALDLLGGTRRIVGRTPTFSATVMCGNSA